LLAVSRLVAESYKVTLEASTTECSPVEAVYFTIRVEPAESGRATLYLYDEKGELVWIEDVSISNGVGTSSRIYIGATWSEWVRGVAEYKGYRSNEVVVTIKWPPKGTYDIVLRASKTTDILEGEIVRFEMTVSPSVDTVLRLYAYTITGELIAEYTVYVTGGHGSTSLVVSVIGTALRWVARDRYGNTSNTVETYVRTEYTITLEADKTEVEKDEAISFHITVDPPATYYVTLEAYVQEKLAFSTSVRVVNGRGEYMTVPSKIGDYVRWRVVDKYGNVSNDVYTRVKGAPPPALTLSASKTSDIERGEPVVFTIRVDPPMSGICKLQAYSDFELTDKRFEVNVSVVNGVGSTVVVPSEIGDVLYWIAVDFGVKSNIVVTRVKGAPSPPTYTLTLMVDSEREKYVDVGEPVTFTLQVSPAVSYTCKLQAYIDPDLKRLLKEFTIEVINGVGVKTLVPSEVGDVVYWIAVDPYLNKSNTVITKVKAPPPPTPPPPAPPPAPPTPPAPTIPLPWWAIVGIAGCVVTGITVYAILTRK
jgi:hypothetical protein